MEQPMQYMYKLRVAKVILEFLLEWHEGTAFLQEYNK